MARKPMGERLPAAPAELEPEANEEAGAAGRVLDELAVGAGGIPPAGRGQSPLGEAWSATPRSFRIALVVCLLPLTVYVLALRVGLSMTHPPVARATPVPGSPAQAAVPGPDQGLPAAPPAAPAPTATPVPAAVTAAAAGSTSTPAPAPSPSATTQTPGPGPTATPQAPGQVASCGAPANPWGYNFCSGNLIRTAPRGFCSFFLCVAHFQEQKRADYVAECYDGTYAQATHGDASCLLHGGEMRPLYRAPGSVGLLAQGGPAPGQAIH